MTPTPEQLARQQIGRALAASGWIVQDRGLRDESLEDSAGHPDPNELAQETADDLRSALELIESVLVDLEHKTNRQGDRA